MAEPQLSSHIQDAIAYFSIMSTEFLRIARMSIKADIMPSDAAYRVVNACYSYYDLTKEAPVDHISDIIADELRGASESKKELVYHFLDRVSQMKSPNMKYTVSQLNTYAKTRGLSIKAVEFVKLVDQQRFSEAELLMYDALKTGIVSEERGYDYMNDPPQAPDEQEERLVTMGLPDFDNLRVLKRQELIVFLGGPKGKKSFAVTHLGTQGLLHGANVLHISHENSQQEVVDRYDRMIVGATHRYWVKDEKVKVAFIDETTERLSYEYQTRPCLRDDAVSLQARSVMRKFGGRLIVKKYPMYSATAEELERYLDYLERFENFVPDIMINDYPDIMKTNPNNATRDNLNILYMTHKRWADDRNMLVAVVSQARREAIRAKRLTMKDFAEDIRKLSNVDLAIGICQTDAQSEAGLAVLYVLAARTGRSDVGCGIVQNLDIGQFATQSYPVSLGVQVAEDAEEE